MTQLAGAVHWALVVQVLLQFRVVVSQRPGAQLVTAGVTQVPVPLHVEGAVLVEAVGQLGAAHWVPAGWRAHWPAAHWPVVPQVDAACTAHRLCGSGPVFTLLQVPAVPFRLQARQAVLHALLQQTPSAQNMLPHSALAPQGAPSGLRPQLLIMPFMPHVFGAMHWALVVHDPKQTLALQW